MATENPRRKTTSGRASQEEAQATGASPVGATAPVLSEEMRDELTSLMQELLLKTHELSFEYSTLDCENMSKCPLAQKSRELFKVVKELNNLVRRMTPQRSQPSYVT